jgi:hypothetical protein
MEMNLDPNDEFSLPDHWHKKAEYLLFPRLIEVIVFSTNLLPVQNTIINQIIH